MRRRGRVGRLGLPLLIAVAMSAAACGSSEITTTPASTAPASTVAGGGDPDQCPAIDFARLPQVSSAPDATRAGEGQDVLLADADAVRGYGNAHADTFGDVWFDYRDGQWILVAGFKSAVDEHRAALLGLVAHPQRLLVCRITRSMADRAQIMAELEALPNEDGRITTISVGVERIVIALRADQEALAKELYERYGPAIDITVGERSYPPSAGGSDQPPCSPLPAVVAMPAGLRVTVEPPAGLTSGMNGQATVRIRNSSKTAYTVNPGIVVLVRPGSRDVVGTYVGPRTMELRVDLVAAGTESTLDDLLGTAPCGPGDGYTLPKGNYDVLSTVNIEGVGLVLSEPGHIQLT